MRAGLKPALTQKEWDEKVVRRGGEGVISFGHGISVENSDPTRKPILRQADELLALMAAANDELPATHPRKITQDQVDLLKQLREQVSERSANWPGLLKLESLIDTLEALLPPQ